MKELNLEKENIGKLLLTFSIPCIISMLINSIYNIVDQIFIGQGVGILGNAATNVIFPIVIICNAVALLIGNGCAAGLSLSLGEKNYNEAKKNIGASVVLLFISSMVIFVLGEALLPNLVNVFGCTENVYQYAIDYGRIILIGAPFMIVYTGISSIIRADGSPRYSMLCLVIGAIINIILDPIFIFGFRLGVKGGALATIIGQFVSFVISVLYLMKIKSVKIEKKDFKINRNIFKVLMYGFSSCVTQLTVLALFVVMNNLMTKYGANSKFGADIPLSVYGVISKVNSIYISLIIGLAVGSQPIVGFNYGAGKYDRVKETIKKVIKTALIIGFIYNVIIVAFPKQIISVFGGADNELYLEFAISFCRIFLAITFINAFEMCVGNLIQSLGNAKKAALVSFTRQIILFIPISIVLCSIYGVYGALYAAPITDFTAFLVVSVIFLSEYRKIGKNVKKKEALEKKDKNTSPLIKNTIITINREYASGGRYVGKILAEKLGIDFYDKELIKLSALNSGLSEEYIESTEQTKNISNSYYNNDDKLYIAESNTIKEIAQKGSCVIIGRCSDYILKDNKNLFSIFLYSDDIHKVKRAVKYYNIPEKEALSEINKINKMRAKHYKYYTNREWKNFENYDLAINVDKLGVEETAEIIKDIVCNRSNS